MISTPKAILVGSAVVLSCCGGTERLIKDITVDSTSCSAFCSVQKVDVYLMHRSEDQLCLIAQLAITPGSGDQTLKLTRASVEDPILALRAHCAPLSCGGAACPDGCIPCFSLAPLADLQESGVMPLENTGSCSIAVETWRRIGLESPQFPPALACP
jgi:hypothetical protein